MRYMLLIYSDKDTRGRMTPEELEKISAGFGAFTQEIAGTGELISASALQDVDTATTIRLQAGEPVATDGPFAETKEYLCGSYVVECADLDRAIELAGRCPGVALGSIEVRPVAPPPEGS
jgi:hypothetical protein